MKVLILGIFYIRLKMTKETNKQLLKIEANMFPVKLSLMGAQRGPGSKNSLAEIAGMADTRDVHTLNVSTQATLLSQR